MRDLTSVITRAATAVGAARAENGDLLLLIHVEDEEPCGVAISDSMGEGLIDALREVLDRSSAPSPARH